MLDLSQSSAKGPKEMGYLIKELTAIKEQLHAKLNLFKARSDGNRAS